MAATNGKQRRDNDEGPKGPGSWIVTFSDCMTLLLCFFVLLLTFSSFDLVSLKKLSGAFEYQTMGSIFPNKRSVPDSMLEPQDWLSSMSPEGSEMPTDDEGRAVRKPRRSPPLPDEEAYKDRKTFYIPSEQMFWGNGSVLKDTGRAHLDMICSFLQMLPCFVIINESSVSTDSSGEDDRTLERAWRIVEYCHKRHQIPLSDFSVAADGGAVSRRRFAGQPVVEVSLISADR